MHLVIVDNETLVQTHIVVEYLNVSEKNIEIKDDSVRVYTPGEELFFNRSLFFFKTPRKYGVYLYREDRDYKHKRDESIERAHDWIKYDQFSAGFDNAFVMLDSEDFMITILVKPSSKILIEREEGYEDIGEITTNRFTVNGINVFKLF